MNRLLTTLLVWLLMAALPLHAVAASINMSCAPVPSQAPAAPMAGHAAHAAPDHAHEPANAGAHAHHGGHAASAPDTAADEDGHHAKAGKLSHSSCSACSAFCAGAVAPPSFSLPMPAFEGSDALLVAHADVVAGFIPDGLRRPPRH
ncbi:MAG: hypothetical protein AB1584_09415 [Pseudomonadota bacterium]